MPRHPVRLLLGTCALLLALGHALSFWRVPFIEVLDAYFYDARVRLFMPGGVDERVAIVDIDERSLARIGRWPWRRDVVAELVRKLHDDYRVTVIGFDIVFAEPDNSSGLRSLEALAEGELRGNAAFRERLATLRGELDFDQRLADTLRSRPVVLGYYFSNTPNPDQAGVLPAPLGLPPGLAGQLPGVLRWQGYGGNLPALQQAAGRAGHFNPVIDFDGVARRVPLIVEHGGQYYEALSVAVLRRLFGDSELGLGIPDPAAGVEWLEVASPRGPLSIPVDAQLAALVPYRGPERSFPYLSAVDVLDGKIPPELLIGRIVLVGTSAPGLMDLRSTPVGGAYPGVEVHANLIAGALSAEVPSKPAYFMVLDALLLLLAGGLLIVLLPRLSPLRATLLSLAVLGGLLGINAALWLQAYVLPLAGGALLVLGLFVLNMSWGFFVESRTKRQFADLFGQYVPPELVDEMARDPESYSMAGRNEELTVLFSDVRDFTTLSEGMEPRELTQLMNEYLGAMTQVIREQRGTLDKYIGDAIMAFWGAPVADSEHAGHAVATALAMQQAVRGLDGAFAARGWPRLQIGVGINTGVVTVGDMGSPVRKAYTVMGDAVNLASRLEAITKRYGVGIVVGERTQALLAAEFAFRELDRVQVKGKTQAVSIFEPLARLTEVTPAMRDSLAAWQAFLDAFRGRAWTQAERLLQGLRQAEPGCALYEIYAERLAALQVDPPGASWEAVTVLEAKS